MSPKLPLALLLMLVVACLVQVCFASWLSNFKEGRKKMERSKNYNKFHDASGKIICNEDAFKGWLYFGGIKSLDEEFYRKDITEFPSKCDITKYLEAAFRKSEKIVYGCVKNALYMVLDDKFIEEYEASDPHKSILHLGSISKFPEENCCYPDQRSLRAASTALDRVVELKEPSMSLRNLADMNKLVQNYIFEPCTSYWQILRHHLFRNLNSLVTEYLDNNWTFISKQSDEFKVGVFRYQFCRRLEPEGAKNRFVRLLHAYYTSTL